MPKLRESVAYWCTQYCGGLVYGASIDNASEEELCVDYWVVVVTLLLCVVENND